MSERDALIRTLVAAKTSIEAALDLLRDATPQCSHPPAQRSPLSGFGAAEHWQCRACGYEYKGGEHGAQA